MGCAATFGVAGWCRETIAKDVLQLSGWLARDVKESRNGNPTRDLQMAALGP